MKQYESKTFDTSTLEGLEAAEKYQQQLYDKYDEVEVKPIGINRVIVTGRKPRE